MLHHFALLMAARLINLARKADRFNNSLLTSIFFIFTNACLQPGHCF